MWSGKQYFHSLFWNHSVIRIDQTKDFCIDVTLTVTILSIYRTIGQIMRAQDTLKYYENQLIGFGK